jgi:methylated-DNA-[protein]-cysteine S-methyltransferase
MLQWPIMTDRGFMLFDTQIGPCGIAWGDRGVIAVQLPEGDEAKTRARLLRRCPHAREAAPPAAVQDAIEGIISLLRGEGRDLSAIALDMDGLPSFDHRVYEVARTIAPGATLSYGEIAARLGTSALARDVGSSTGAQPIPDHRAVPPRARRQAAKWAAFSANGGITTKLRLLTIGTRAYERYALPCSTATARSHSRCGPGAATRAEARDQGRCRLPASARPSI